MGSIERGSTGLDLAIVDKSKDKKRRPFSDSMLPPMSVFGVGGTRFEVDRPGNKSKIIFSSRSNS